MFPVIVPRISDIAGRPSVAKSQFYNSVENSFMYIGMFWKVDLLKILENSS